MFDVLQKARLEKWTISGHSLVGLVFDHPDKSLRDGRPVTTSYLRFIDEEKGIAVTKNTVYYLGEKDNG